MAQLKSTHSASGKNICLPHAADKSTMRARRPISVNNSLCHGICNYNCKLCGVNKASYRGPREFQPREVTEKLIQRISDAARAGVEFRIITNSGDGEPTLHPEFGTRLDMFGRMIRDWDAPVPAPELTLVTNASNLLKKEVTDALVRNPVTVNISFPSADPDHYGELMFCSPQKGAAAMEKALAGIRHLFRLQAREKIDRICFHISPPDRDIIRQDFSRTVDVLTAAAGAAGVSEIELVMFPGTSNRSGLIRNSITSTDFYKDLFKKHHNRETNGVTVKMTTVLKRFFKSTAEICDMVRANDYPCIWNANFFIAPDGSSICCNDQAVKNPFGNIMHSSLPELMHRKETYMPNSVCRSCDQQPHRMKGSFTALLLNLASRVRMKLSGASRHLKPDTPAPEKSRTLSERLIKRPGALSRRLNAVERKAVSCEKFVSQTAQNSEEKTVFSLADTEEDLLAACRLVYEQYRSYGYAEDNPGRLRATLWNALPGTYTLLARKRGRVVGTVSYIMDSEIGLPMDEAAGGQMNKLRDKGRRICEVSALAVDNDQADAQTLTEMFQYGFVLVRRFLEATDYVITVNPKHAQFYQRVFGFEQLGSAFLYTKVRNAPGVPMRLDIEKLVEKYRNSHAAGDTPGNLYRKFSASEAFMAQRISAQMAQRGERFSMALLRRTFAHRTNILSDSKNYAVFRKQWLAKEEKDRKNIRCAV